MREISPTIESASPMDLIKLPERLNSNTRACSLSETHKPSKVSAIPRTSDVESSTPWPNWRRKVPEASKTWMRRLPESPT